MVQKTTKLLACVLPFVAVAASSAYASTGFGIERYSLTATNEDGSADMQAGSHAYELTAEAKLDTGTQAAGEVRNLSFELPPGLILDGAAVARCGHPEFREGHCPANTAVGVVVAKLGGKTESVVVYNIVPGPEALAELGFGFADFLVIAEVAAGPGGGYGMTVSIRDFPGPSLESVKLTLGGASSSAFLTLPTSCAGSQSTTLQGESWGAETASLSASFPQMLGCELLSFEPAIDAVQEIREASVPSGYRLEVQVPQNEGPLGLAAAQLQRAAVVFPAGVSLAPSGMEGVVGCSEAEFGLTSTGPGTCPSASHIGTFELEMPLLDGLGEDIRGSIDVAESGTSPSGMPMGLYLEAEREGSDGGGLLVKLAGQLTQDPATGRLTLSLNDIPQLPLSNIELIFNGGRRALFANPPTCGTFTTNSELAPWGEGPDAMPSSSFQITEGADGGPCPLTPSSPPPSGTATTGGPGAASTTTAAATDNTGSVSLDGSTITVQSNGKALVKLACTGTGACVGKLSLTVKVPFARGAHVKVKTKTETETRTKIIGTADFSIPQGKTVSVEVALDSAGRALSSAAHGHLDAGLKILKSLPAPARTSTENVRLALDRAAKAKRR